MWIALAIGLLVLVIAVVLEFKIRKPDDIILYESNGKIKTRCSRFYPKHFSLAIPTTVQTKTIEVTTEAKGGIGIKVTVNLSVAAEILKLKELVQAGGWKTKAVKNALDELSFQVQSLTSEFSEKYEVEEISRESLTTYIKENLKEEASAMGLKIISGNVQTIDPVETEISEKIQERETARIFEQTESANQQARLTAARARIDTDEKIAQLEHELALKKIALKSKEEIKEAKLLQVRVIEETKRRKLQLEVDANEIELLTNNPELLLLTPQAARLAEASQNLKNAKTVISVSGKDAASESPLMKMLMSLIDHTGVEADSTKDIK